MHFKVTREGGAYCFTSCRKESTQLSPGGITSLLLAEDGEVVCACVHFQTCVFTRPDVYRRLMMSRIFKCKDSVYADPHKSVVIKPLCHGLEILLGAELGGKICIFF